MINYMWLNCNCQVVLNNVPQAALLDPNDFR